eukprot:749354-Hanusia_phi.AAC.2
MEEAIGSSSLEVRLLHNLTCLIKVLQEKLRPHRRPFYRSPVRASGSQVRGHNSWVEERMTAARATIVLKLVDRGDLSLDDKPSRYLDFWKPAPNDKRSGVELRHLLSFTSGDGGDEAIEGADARQAWLREGLCGARLEATISPHAPDRSMRPTPTCPMLRAMAYITPEII